MTAETSRLEMNLLKSSNHLLHAMWVLDEEINENTDESTKNTLSQIRESIRIDYDTIWNLELELSFPKPDKKVN